MRSLRNAALVALLALASSGAQAAISKTFGVFWQPAGGSATTGGTSGGFSTTGATHVIVMCKNEGAAADWDLTAATGSTLGTVTYSSNPLDLGTTLHGRVAWAPLTATNASSTFAITWRSAATRPWTSCAIWTITAGTANLTVVSEANNTGTGTAMDGGTLSNAGGASIVSFMAALESDGVTHTGSAGWTEDVELAGGGAGNYTAYYSRGAETTTSIDPAVTQTSSASWGIISISLAEASVPTLSSATPSGTLGTSTTATIGATTTVTSGTFYAVVDTDSLTGISVAQVKAAQDAGGGAVVASCNAAVSTTTPSCGVTGLTASTAYNFAVVQNSTGGDSNVIATGTFTTAGAATGLPKIIRQLLSRAAANDDEYAAQSLVANSR